MTKIISAENISKNFNNGPWVLDNISLEIQKGDFVSIVGASGSGKSTLLTILGGMDLPTQGKVFIDDEDITVLKESRLAKLRRTKIGFVFQFFNLAPYLTVEENIILPVILNGGKKKDYTKRLDYLLDYLGIAQYRHKMPSKLSGGEQQRVAIARGLIFEPEVIFLDEPTGNLDSKSSQNIMELLAKINAELGTTILQVTHSGKNAQYGNKIITIQDGKIIER
ncbi:MAG: ABC transporter ATP-binding protein [Clostridia bacterium]|nr:ABC transporter ATP-binding protein [Clostridia bacterium]